MEKLRAIIAVSGLLMLTTCGPAAPPDPPDPPEPVECGAGLAATDLAGNCRATPRATMGALEAVQ